jgi:protein-S-isoprenylcysteine O-methyltransferase Ste14
MTIIIYLAYAFALSELILMIVKRSRAGTAKTRSDKGSLIVLWIMITIGFTVGFILSKPFNPFWTGLGLISIAGGLFIRWLAILQLGRSFTVDVAITDVAKLKTDGLYRRLRHPSYSGLLSVVVGFSAAMNSIFSFLVFVIPVFLAVIYRIRVEEGVLRSEFGDSYIEYEQHTKRIIPGVY